MPNNETLHSVVMDKFFEGFALKKDGGLKVVNEDAAKQASSALSKIVLEQARDWWGQLEAAEESLANVADEISFEEMNADPSSQQMDHGSHSADDEAPEMQAQGQEEMAMESADLKNLLGSEDFDLSSIFEMDHMDDEDAMMDDDADGEVVDGDENMDDLKLGMDSMSGEGEDGDDADMRDLGDEGGMDDDESGGETDMDSLDPEADPEMGEYGDEEEFDFDLGSDDEGLDLGDDDEEDMDEMRGRHHAMESDDEGDDDEDEDED